MGIMKKRIVLVLLSIICAFNFLGCKKGDNSDDSSQNSTESESSKVAEKSLNETVSALRKDEFAVSSLADDGFYGLSDESNVGVNKSTYENEVKYPIPSNDAFEGTVIKWSEFESEGDNFSKFKSILSLAAEENSKGINVKLDMPENEIIDMDTTNGDNINYAVYQKNLNGFYLQGNNCLFRLSYKNLDWKGFLSLENCDNVWMENIRIDYAVPNTLAGTIEAYDAKNYTISVAIDKEFNEFAKRLISNSGHICSYLEYGKATKIPKVGGNYFVDSVSSGTVFDGYEISGDEQNGYKILIKLKESQKAQFHTVSLGDLASIAFSYYNYNAINYTHCGTVRMENVTLYFSPSMGVVSLSSDNILINRLKITLPEDSARLLTCCSDAVHIYQQRGKVEITNSLIEYTHDDATNVKSGYFYSLGGYNIKDHTIIMTRDTSSIDMPKAGDVISIYERESFELKGSFTVVDCSGNSNSYTVKVKESLASTDIGDWAQCAVTNTSCAEFIFKNNIVRNKRNRGVLCMAQNAVIENNTFKNVAHGAILNISFLDQFNEATVPNGTTIRNNKLIGNNYELSPQGDILVSASTANSYPKTGVIRGVTVENNFITGGGGAGIALIATSDCTVSNNLLFNVCKKYRGDECQILVQNSFNAKVTGNYAYSDSTTILGVYAKGSTDVSSITATGNHGCDLETGAFVKKSVTVKKIDASAITIDGDVSEWETFGTDIEIVGASYSDETHANEDEYSEGFGVKMAKLGVTDSGIYFAFSVRDDLLDFKQTGNFWFGDCVEVIATAFKDYSDEDVSSYKNRKDTVQAIFAPSWNTTDGWDLCGDRTSNTIYQSKDKINAKCIYTEDGYSGEMFIPFSVCPDFYEAYNNGDNITFNVVFMDGERNGRARVHIGNVPHLVELYKKQSSRSFEYYFEK